MVSRIHKQCKDFFSGGSFAEYTVFQLVIQQRAQEVFGREDVQQTFQLSSFWMGHGLPNCLRERIVEIASKNPKL